MKKLILLFAITIVSLSCQKEKKEEKKESKVDKEVNFAFDVPKNRTKKETVYYIIRHAEKDTKDPEDKDPFLTEKGIERANHWATYFEDKEIAQIFSSEYKRTTQTAIPTASIQQLNIQNYDSNNDRIFSNGFWHKTYGKINLIVGHSNTNPRIANEILGFSKYEDLDESEHNQVFKIVITKDLKVKDSLYTQSEPNDNPA